MGFAAAREKAGMTQTEVAKRMKVDQSAISQWENGKTAPRAGLLLELSQLYGCTVDELLRENKPSA